MCGSNNSPVSASRKMQTQGPGTGRTAEGAPQERQRGTERDYNRSTQFVDSLLDIFNPQKAGTQTTTQQNLPNWAIPDAMSTLGLGNYYTQNPDYRPGSLDRDYSAVRGLNQYGEPMSQAGSFGLAPAGFQAQPRPAPPGVRPNLDDALMQAQTGGPLLRSSRGGGRQYGTSPGPSSGQGQSYTPAGGGGDSYEVYDQSTNPASGLTDPVGEGVLIPSGGGSSSSQTNTQSSSSSTTPKPEPKPDPEPEPIDPKTIFDPDNVTPFAYYDRQRFAAPGAGTVRGEGLLQGRYDQRFGPNGTNPFSGAETAIDKAANYGSTYSGITDSQSQLAKAGGYQTGLKTAQNPGVFSGKSYADQNLQNTFSNPNAGMANVNAGMANVNANMTANQYGNANANLAGPVNYNQGKSLREGMRDFTNPYNDQVVNQSLKDLDRARKMTNAGISGDAAKAGAFGGSREALMRSENNRNFFDRAGALAGQLRQQGFNTASTMAQDEQMKRLGLTASDTQNVRGYQSSGNLQGQTLTAQDRQNVRGYQSQGGLAAQGLQSQGALAAQGLRSQGGLAAQGLQSQGALAALGANADLYSQGLGLGAGMDRAALQANAGLLSDAMGLDASDLRQRRDIASNEAQFQENALRNAGALNLQGGNALANLAQFSTADERQRITDMMRGAAGQDMRNQQDLDFIRSEFDRELQYPGYQIDLRNRAISPATNSVVTQTQDVYGRSPLSNIAALASLYYGAA